MQLEGNKILLTGATSGIGEAMLGKFLSRNNQIIAVGRNEQKLQHYNRMDARVIPFACDLSKREELLRLQRFVETGHPDVNVLVNNAGIQENYSFSDEKSLEMRLEQIEREINTNLTAPIQLVGMVLPVLRKNHNPVIVNVTSALGLVPKNNAAVYSGTKGGLHLFTRVLRAQLHDVRVVELIPSLVDTPMTTGRGTGKISPEELVEEFVRKFEKGMPEIRIGKVKILRLINRLSPALASKIINK